MFFYTNQSQFNYDFENLLKIFISKKDLKITADPLDTADFYVSLTFEKDIRLFCSENNQVLVNQSFEVTSSSLKNQMKGILYDFLVEHFEKTSPWGILVGIRPVKIVHDALDKGRDITSLRQYMLKDLRVTEEKVDLAINIARRERPYLYPVDSRAISLYICIPFCPTRCLYCSFPSNSTEKKKHCIEPYVSALIKEIHGMGDYINANNLYIDCIYFGGGTPTSLSAKDIKRIMNALELYFDLKNLKEFTFEAGRPDTITKEKLDVLSDHHVNRLCLNPQTFNDDTLVKIGRQHSVDEIFQTYNMIKQYNFKSINMDIILGLVDESAKHIEKTIDGLEKLQPENITVHTLSVKRASRLNQNREDYALVDDPVESYMERINSALKSMAYVPYYMYRQKNILANLENTGYTKEGYESLYNMRIMEEKHTILALGAGAVSKFVNYELNQFNRVANSKGLEDYIDRIDEMIEKKLKYLKKLSSNID